jgi:hypothetical protein
VFTQLQQQRWFCRLQSQLAQRQEMQQLFDQECPLELTGQCRVLGFKYQCLQVELTNAGSATQLQFRTRELLAALRKYPIFAELKKIQSQIVRVTVASDHEPLKDKPAPALSPDILRMFGQVADGLEEGELKAALLKLIK